MACPEWFGLVLPGFRRGHGCWFARPTATTDTAAIVVAVAETPRRSRRTTTTVAGLAPPSWTAATANAAVAGTAIVSTRSQGNAPSGAAIVPTNATCSNFVLSIHTG